MLLLHMLLYIIQIMSASNGVLTGINNWIILLLWFGNKISFLFDPWLKDIWLYWGWTEAYMLILGKRNLACHWSVSKESKSDKPVSSFIQDMLSALKHKTDSKCYFVANWCKGEKKGAWTLNKMCCILITCSYLTAWFKRQLLSYTVKNIPLRDLCSPSFAPCLPYKYSSRIKSLPLACRPLTNLGRSISYHSSCVACWVGCVPDETMRARVRGGGGSLACPCGHCYARHLPVLTIFRKFKPWHSWIHEGAVKSGPIFVCQKCVWVIEGEIWPSWALKRSKSMDSAILKGKTIQFKFSHMFSWGTGYFG